MKRALRLVSFVFAVGLHYVSNAQGDDFAKATDFLPPAPNASAIIKSSMLSANKNTGAPNMSIPLGTVKGYNLTAPVSLSYNSTGIKVDEIASRAGMGWVLNAGGVVTRTVRGAVDELNTRVLPPATFTNNCETYFFLKNVNDCNDGNRFNADAEPDIFSYSMNGLSGTFVLNASGQPVLVSSEKYKISVNLDVDADFNFRITATDGIVYSFGGISAVEKTKRSSSCGRNYDAPIATSWYLTQIMHPNGEIITFTYTPLTYSYETGVSETMDWQIGLVFPPTYDDPNTRISGISCPECPPARPLKRCVNKVTTYGYILSGISSNSGNSLNLYYITRTDCNDRLISELKFFSSEGLFSSYNFDYNMQDANIAFANEIVAGYDKTPYLTGVREYSSQAQFIGEYRFSYNDPGARPPRLSFSQDHWGYFNGAYNRSTFIPTPTDALFIQRFPYANADRESYDGFAAKGMLCKIVSPGGGVDSIIYEPNLIAEVPPAPLHVLNGQITGSGIKTTVTNTSTFTISFKQNVELQQFCVDNGTATVDPAHNVGLVQLYSAGVTIHSQSFPPGFTGNVIYELNPGVYTLSVSATGSVITTRASVKYRPLNSSIIKANRIIGGCRVKYLLKGSPGHQTTVKRYYYGELESPELSTLSAVPPKVYLKDNITALACQTQILPDAIIPSMGFCKGYNMFSNSISNLFDFGGSPISYSSVIESDGEGFENGCMQTRFFIRTDAPGEVVWGSDIIGSPQSNFSAFLNGKPKEEISYKKNTQGVLIPLKKTTYSYVYDNRDQAIVSGISVEKRYTPTTPLAAEGCPPATLQDPERLMHYNAVRYDIMSFWVHLDFQTDIIYDQDGQNPVTTITTYSFDNALHHNLTKTMVTNSKNEQVITELKYPHDFIEQPGYSAMISRNMLNNIIEANTYINTQKTSGTKVNYFNWGGGNISMQSVDKTFRDGVFQTDGTINQVDEKGRAVQFTGKDGVTKSIIWGGRNCQYPIASITGASYPVSISKLTVIPTALCTADDNLIRSQINLIRTGIPDAKVETYNYKAKTGLSAKIDLNGNLTTYEYDSKDRLMLIRDKDNNILKRFDYYLDPSVNVSLKLFYNTPQNQSFTCQICLPGYTALPVTYNLPENSVFSSVSTPDANSKALNLIQLRGQAYANRYSICSKGAMVYYSAAYSASFTKNDCGPAYTGSVVVYSKPYGAYTAATPEDANQLAVYYVNTEGQAYANANGSCTPVCTSVTCSGVNKKCINGLCQTGAKIYTSSTQVQGSLWECIYHFEWSDGSWSQNYTEYSSSRCITDF